MEHTCHDEKKHCARPCKLHAECSKPFGMSCHVVMLVGQVTVKVAEARILKLHVHML